MINDWCVAVVQNEGIASTIFVMILGGFSLRVIRMQQGSSLYNMETAGKRVLFIILGMIVLSYCYSSNNTSMPDDLKTLLEVIAVVSYVVLAITQSFNTSGDIFCFLIALLKFCMVYAFAVSDGGWKFAISIVFLWAGIKILKTWDVDEDEAKLRLIEIILCSVESIIFALILLCNDTVSILFEFEVMYVVFEETVLYSINDLILFCYKEKHGLPVVEE